MDDTYIVNGMVLRNPLVNVDGSFATLLATNTYPAPTPFTVNLNDLEAIKDKRWVCYSGQIFSIDEQRVRLIPIANIILRRPLTERVNYKDGNATNVTRHNLSKPKVDSTPNVIRYKGNTAEIVLQCGRVAIIDRTDAELVKGFRWLSVEVETQKGIHVICKTVVKEGRNKVSYLLSRVILDCEKGDRTRVKHLNGNRLDCRRQNLIRGSDTDGH